MFIFVILTGRADPVQPFWSTSPSVGDPGSGADLCLAAWGCCVPIHTGDGWGMYSLSYTPALGVLGIASNALGTVPLTYESAVFWQSARLEFERRTLLFNSPRSSSLVTHITCDSPDMLTSLPTVACGRHWKSTFNKDHIGAVFGSPTHWGFEPEQLPFNFNVYTE